LALVVGFAEAVAAGAPPLTIVNSGAALGFVFTSVTGVISVFLSSFLKFRFARIGSPGYLLLRVAAGSFSSALISSIACFSHACPLCARLGIHRVHFFDLLLIKNGCRIH
jgi:hypothetical protein